MTSPHPEMVAVEWLRTVMPGLDARVAVADIDTIRRPPDEGENDPSYFVLVTTIGGTPALYMPMRPSLISIDFYARSPNSHNPKWGAAMKMASELINYCQTAAPAKITPTAGLGFATFRSPVVHTVAPQTDARRIEDDPNGYAHVSLDVLIHWSDPDRP